MRRLSLCSSFNAAVRPSNRTATRIILLHISHYNPQSPANKNSGATRLELCPSSHDDKTLWGICGIHVIIRFGKWSLVVMAMQSRDRLSEAHLRHAAHYLEVVRGCDDLYLQGGENLTRGLASFDLEWSNIEAGHRWAVRWMREDKEARRIVGEYPHAGVYLLSLRQHPHERIVWLEVALEAARQLQDPENESNHLNNFGLTYAALGEMRRAIEFYKQALVIDREIGDRRGEGIILGNLGIAYKNLDEPRRAIEYHVQSLNISRELGDRRREANALGNMGNVHADLGELRRAIELYEQALVIVQEMGDRRDEGNALGNLGLAYADIGEMRRAIEYHEQYLAIAREIGDRRGEGNATNNLGVAYAKIGEMRRALKCYVQYLAIAREIGDRRGEGNALFNMSRALYHLGQREQAITLVETALAIYEQLESPAAVDARKQLKIISNVRSRPQTRIQSAEG